MNDIIDRAFRGEATAAELERLAAWRASSPECEREYQASLRLLRAAVELGRARPDRRAPAAAELLERPALRPKLARAAVPWAVAAAAVLALAAVLARREPAAEPFAWGSATVSTGPTELTTVTLADGSVVRLGPSSELQVVPGAGARDVLLDGQAFFDVVKLAGRPFRVRTRHGRAAVLGTRFQVSTRGDRMELVVVEGRVALSDGAAEVEVSSGQASGIVGGRVLPPQPVVNADSVTQWVGKFLVFQDTPLAEAVLEIERVYGVRITIEDTVMANRTVTASFTNRELSHVTSVLCAVVNARCIQRAGELVITR